MKLTFKVILPVEQGPAALAERTIDEDHIWVGMLVRFPFSDGHVLDIRIGDVRKDYDEGEFGDSQHVQVVRTFLERKDRVPRWYYADAPREELFQRWTDAGWKIQDWDMSREKEL